MSDDPYKLVRDLEAMTPEELAEFQAAWRNLMDKPSVKLGYFSTAGDNPDSPAKRFYRVGPQRTYRTSSTPPVFPEPMSREERERIREEWRKTYDGITGTVTAKFPTEDIQYFHSLLCGQPVAEGKLWLPGSPADSAQAPPTKPAVNTDQTKTIELSSEDYRRVSTPPESPPPAKSFELPPIDSPPEELKHLLSSLASSPKIV